MKYLFNAIFILAHTLLIANLLCILGLVLYYSVRCICLLWPLVCVGLTSACVKPSEYKLKYTRLTKFNWVSEYNINADKNHNKYEGAASKQHHHVKLEIKSMETSLQHQLVLSLSTNKIHTTTSCRLKKKFSWRAQQCNWALALLHSQKLLCHNHCRLRYTTLLCIVVSISIVSCEEVGNAGTNIAHSMTLRSVVVN